MKRSDIESLIQPDAHPAWEDFCYTMSTCSYGYDALVQAWVFFKKGWNAMQFQHTQLEQSMLERVRVAEVIRDDARASSQRYLDEKREADAHAYIFQYNMENLYMLRDLMRDLGDDFAVEPKEPFSKKGARDLNEILSTVRDIVKKL